VALEATASTPRAMSTPRPAQPTPPPSPAPGRFPSIAPPPRARRHSASSSNSAVPTSPHPFLHLDGDTGAYSGTYKDGKWTQSHFDGSRTGVIEVSTLSGGTPEILQNIARPKPAASATGQSAPQSAEEPIDSRYTTKLIAYRSARRSHPYRLRPALTKVQSPARQCPPQATARATPPLPIATRLRAAPYRSATAPSGVP